MSQRGCGLWLRETDRRNPERRIPERRIPGAVDASDLLKPQLARGELACVGATTTNEYRLIEKDVALARRFQPITVPEPSVAQSITILRGLKERYQVARAP